MPRISCFLFLFFFNPSFSAALPPKEAGKAAYRLNYQGTLFYAEGKFALARKQFQRAYEKAPGNFQFALSYGLSLGRTGRHQKAISVLTKAQRLLPPDDPEYALKSALCSFYQGAAFLYSDKPGRAIAPLRQSAELLEPKGNNELRSIILNALGYAVLLDQGTGEHRKAGLPLHGHVHRRSLERAYRYFHQALIANPDNQTARSNSQTLADSLQINRDSSVLSLPDSSLPYQAPESRSVFMGMQQRLFQDLQLFRYDELLFLVDISGSMVMENVICMNATRFEVMKEMVQKLLPEIPAYTALGMGTIGGDCGTVPKQWKPAGSLSKEDIHDIARFLIPDGTTPLLSMLVAAPGLFSDTPSKSKSIFLISDGANTCREVGLDICSWAKQISEKNISINILTFLSTTSDNTDAFAEYLCLAELTGGQIIYLDNYRCRLEPLALDLVKTCTFTLPEFQRSSCWGPSVKDLWMIPKKRLPSNQIKRSKKP